MLNIILFGAPGCGKGTQAALIKEKYNINHISTGEVIRGEIARGTELGKSMQSYIEAGKLAGIAEPEHEPAVKTNFIR